MTPEEANLVASLNLKVLANMNSGLPPHANIDKAELRKAVDICRADYQAAQSKSKASGTRNPSTSAPAVDLAALFTERMSKPKGG